MYFVMRSKLAVTRNLLKCKWLHKQMVSWTNHPSLQPWRQVNITTATIALPVVQFLHGVAIYNSMSLASQLRYFRLVCRKFSTVYILTCVHLCGVDVAYWSLSDSTHLQWVLHRQEHIICHKALQCGSSQMSLGMTCESFCLDVGRIIGNFRFCIIHGNFKVNISS